MEARKESGSFKRGEISLGTRQESDPRVAGQKPRKIPKTAHAPAPGAESTASTPRGLLTAPEQHARDREVGEAADAPRHQLQLRFGHGRMHVRGREEVGVCRSGASQSGKQGRGVPYGRGSWVQRGLARGAGWAGPERGVASARLGVWPQSGSNTFT